MLLVLPTIAVEVKESCHLMRDLELHLFLDSFPETYTENEAATAIANTLKRAPDREEEVVNEGTGSRLQCRRDRKWQRVDWFGKGRRSQ